jgi:hypothetical protein
MPFALNEATEYINPTKTLEYMAAGKPIVSTAVADVVRNFTPVVRVARTAAEFVTLSKQVAAEPNSALIAQGLDQASKASWESIVGQMRQLLQPPAEQSAPTLRVARRRPSFVNELAVQ